MKWMKTSNRRIFFDMHFPDWQNKGICENFDPKALAQSFSDSNVDSVIAYAKCQYGNFYYDTAIGHKHSGLGEINLLQELIEECHKYDIKVIAYYSVSWDEWAADMNPEWQVIKSDGTYDTDEFRWKTMCINSPYRLDVKNHIEEITRVCKPDGFWIDMTIIGEDRCYCEHCQKSFEETYGIKLIVEDIQQNPTNRNRFMQFRYDYIESFYEEIYGLIKSIDPNSQVTNNYWGYPYSTATMGSRACGALKSTDYVTGEAYTDWTGLNAPSFFSKFLRGVSEGKAYETLIGRFYNTWDYTTKPDVQLAMEAYTSVSNGACVTIDDEPFHDGQLDEALYHSIGEIYGNIKKRENYLGGTHSKYAAILHSQQTKDYYSNYGDLDFVKSVAGSFKMMRDLHMITDFVFDETIDSVDLSSYKLIILSSVAVMSDELIKKLRDYVLDGGVILMNGVNGLYKVNDYECCEDFERFSSIFDIPVNGIGAYSLSYLNGRGLKRPSLVKGKYVNYGLTSEVCEIDGYITEPICETTKDVFFHNNLPAPHKMTDMPSTFVKVLGKGKIIGFSQPVMSHYAKQSQLELRGLVEDLVKLHCDKPKVELSGPSRLDIDVWEKDGDLVIHVLNPNPALSVCCGYMDPFEGAYPRTLEYMDEIIPVYDVALTVGGRIEKEAICGLSGESDLKVEYSNGQTTIVIEKLMLWESIVIKNLGRNTSSMVSQYK